MITYCFFRRLGRTGAYASSSIYSRQFCHIFTQFSRSSTPRHLLDSLHLVSYPFIRIYSSFIPLRVVLSRGVHRPVLPGRDKGTYPGCAFNLRPATVTDNHTDPGNQPCVPCSVTALGSHDPDKGGHLYLEDLNIIIRFPSGATIPFSPAFRYNLAKSGILSPSFAQVAFIGGFTTNFVQLAWFLKPSGNCLTEILWHVGSQGGSCSLPHNHWRQTESIQ